MFHCSTNMSIPKIENSSSVAAKLPAKPYGKIVLTLKNCLLPESKLVPTPSQTDGLEAETEIDQRILGCEMIQIAGILLKLPQVAMATGQVLFQRFYYSKSFVRHAMETTAMGCICLASKIEEAPRRIRDVINVFHHIKQIKGQKTIAPMMLDHTYIALKSQVIKAERRVLKELGFCVHVKHPHKIIVMYLQVLGYEKHHTLMQMAWNYMNDALRTDLFVRYQPETVACACIYLTSRKLGICLPKSPPWFKIFKVTELDLQDVGYRILRLYKRPKANADELERRVEDLRRHYQEIRLKARGNAAISGANTPAHSPTPAVIKSPERKEKRPPSPNARGGFVSRPTNNSHNNVDKRSGKSRSKTPIRDRSPLVLSKHAKKSKKRSRSRDVDRSSSAKKSSNHHKGRSHSSRSPSLSPLHNRHSRKSKYGDKTRYRSRSRSPKRRSASYDRYDNKYYDKSSKSRSKRTSRSRDEARIKDRR